MLTAERLRQLLKYDAKTGRWRRTAVRRGYEVGSIVPHTPKKDGYVRIGVDMERYLAHRLAWLYVTGRWPEYQIDHINGNRADNRWENLREATCAENGHNRGPDKDNAYGLKGIAKSRDHWRAKPFSARIRVNGKLFYLGRFASPEEAYTAYATAARRLHKTFARIA